MIMNLNTGLTDPFAKELEKKLKKRAGPTIEGAPIKPVPNRMSAPAPQNFAAAQSDLSKVQLGSTPEMSESFKKEFGRPPSQSELQNLVKMRAESKGVAPTFEFTGAEFNPAQDIANQAAANQKMATPEPTLPPEEPFQVSDETITSEDLANTDAVSRLSSLQEVEDKFFKEQEVLDKQILDIDTQIKNFEQSTQAGLDLIADQAIPMGFITGQQASIERRSQRQLQTLADLKAIATKQKELAQSNIDYRLKFATASRLEEEFQMTKEKFQSEQLLSRMELVAKVGGKLTDADIQAIDSKYGAGFAEKYQEVTKEAADVARQGNEIKVASDIVNILSKIPEGQTIDIGTATYTGIKEIDPDKGLHVFTETDDSGNVTQVTTRYNPISGQMEIVSTLGFGTIGNADSGRAGSKQKYFAQPDATGKTQYYFGNPQDINNAQNIGAEEYRKGISTAADIVKPEPFLTKEYFKNLYDKDTLKNAAKKAGYKTKLGFADTEAYLDYIMKSVEARRVAGMDDQEIFKLMSK